MKCRIKGEADSLVLTCWQYDPKAPRPIWVFRCAHNLGGGHKLTMMDHRSDKLIEVNPTDWFCWDKESGGVIVLTAEEFEKGMEILPDESRN